MKIPDFAKLALGVRAHQTKVDAKTAATAVAHTEMMLAASASATATSTEVTSMQADLNRVIAKVGEISVSVKPLATAATKAEVDVATQAARSIKEAFTQLGVEYRAAMENVQAERLKSFPSAKELAAFAGLTP